MIPEYLVRESAFPVRVSRGTAGLFEFVKGKRPFPVNGNGGVVKFGVVRLRRRSALWQRQVLALGGVWRREEQRPRERFCWAGRTEGWPVQKIHAGWSRTVSRGVTVWDR